MQRETDSKFENEMKTTNGDLLITLARILQKYYVGGVLESENSHEYVRPFVYTFLCLYKFCEGVKTQGKKKLPLF